MRRIPIAMAAQQINWSRNQDIFRNTPVTVIIIGIWILGFLTSVMGISAGKKYPVSYELFAFLPSRLPNLITGLVTNPLVMDRDIIGLLLNCLMLFWFGGSLERGWGARKYLLFLIGSSAASAICWQLGLLIATGKLLQMASPWLLISATIVTWAWLNPEQTILLWFVLPLKAKWIGWLTVILVFFSFPLTVVKPGLLVPLLGFFALGGIGFAYFYIWYQRTWAWIPRRQRKQARPLRHPSSTLMGTLLRPYREWQRRRRVAHLQRTIRFDD